jgi:hypothetical protein
MMSAAAAVLVGSAAMLAGASSASAATSDQIWYQSLGNPSQSAPCPESEAADLAKGWTPWVKGYEMWPNDGQGGWTCGRSILWAKGSQARGNVGAGATGCVQVQGDPFTAAWLDFGTGFFSPQGSNSYRDSGCSSLLGTTGWNIVRAADVSRASERCASAIPGKVATTQGWTLPNIYTCVTPI